MPSVVPPPVSGRRRPAWTGSLETRALVLQCSLALAFSLWAVLEARPALLAAALAVGGYHLAYIGYVVGWRNRGRPIRGIERVAPLYDTFCVTIAWVAIGDPGSPAWAFAMFVLVGYVRHAQGVRYVAFAAFVVANLVLGHLVLAQGNGEPLFTADLLFMVVAVLAVAVLACIAGTGWQDQTSDAIALAGTDPLTGLANRRVFVERVAQLAAGGKPFAIVMIDLDNFKSLNDAYGHGFGDQVLARTAALLQTQVRPGDIVARYGGEEFVVALPGAGEEAAVEVAERLRAKVRVGTPATISAGCTARRDDEPPGAVIERADALLLGAKRRGKDCVLSTLAGPMRAA